MIDRTKDVLHTQAQAHRRRAEWAEDAFSVELWLERAAACERAAADCVSDGACTATMESDQRPSAAPRELSQGLGRLLSATRTTLLSNARR